MKILVVGSGAREHAILRALNKEKSHNLYCIGGNPGIWQLAEEIPNVDEQNGERIAEVCVKLEIDLAIIGPEAPLAAGVVDIVCKNSPKTAVFGPTKQAARLESSKSFAKEIMQKAGVPTGSAKKCLTFEEAVSEIKTIKSNSPDDPIVVKADGLAAGKGVIVTDSIEEAITHTSDICKDGGFVIVEEYLDGPEFSMFFICDGKNAIPLIPAQDFKRIFDNDKGPNTGGMGSYTPLDWLPDDILQKCTNEIANPVLEQMSNDGVPFVGVLFAGLVYTKQGVKVIEFNVRFGDPETQVVLEKLQTPLSEVLFAAAKGKLSELAPLKWDDKYYCNVVLASKGYPETSHKGDWIDGIDAANAKGAIILQAGTAFSGSDIGEIVTNGGRVLNVIAGSDNLKLARERAYNYCDMIKFEGKQNRNDIALKAVNNEIRVSNL